MTADEEFRSLMLRVVPVAFIAFGLGALLLHYFMKSLRESDEPQNQNKDSVTVSGTRFLVLVITLFAMGMLFFYFSYQ